MAQLSRRLQKIFGFNGSTSQFGKFGSDNIGSPTTTKDIDEIQELDNFLTGLYASTASASEPPRIQDLNSLFFLYAYQLSYLFQRGIPEYLATETYYEGSYCISGGLLYQSLIDDNIGNAVTDTDSWAVCDPKTAYETAIELDSYVRGSMYRGSSEIIGLTISRSTTDASVVQFVIGSNAEWDTGDSTTSDRIRVYPTAQTITKTIASTFTAGTGNGGRCEGVALSTTYQTWHWFSIVSDSTGDIDFYADTSLTNANIPSGWSHPRRVVSIVLNDSYVFPYFFMTGNTVYMPEATVLTYTAVQSAILIAYDFWPAGIKTRPLLSSTITINGVGSANTSYVAFYVGDGELGYTAANDMTHHIAFLQVTDGSSSDGVNTSGASGYGTSSDVYTDTAKGIYTKLVTSGAGYWSSMSTLLRTSGYVDPRSL